MILKQSNPRTESKQYHSLEEVEERLASIRQRRWQALHELDADVTLSLANETREEKRLEKYRQVLLMRQQEHSLL